jgi:hypothetical protein
LPSADFRLAGDDDAQLMHSDPSHPSAHDPAADPARIGIAGTGLRLRPYLRPEGGSAEGESPFVLLGDGVLPYRALLASGKLDGQPILPFVTLLLQQDTWPGFRGGTPLPGATNAQIDRVWDEAFRNWRGSDSEGLTRLEHRLLADPDTLPRHPPVTFCTRIGAYFEPVCPECFGRLDTCRDEVLLRTAGLPGYADTLQRFLHCPACTGAAGALRVVYTASTRTVDGAAPTVRVRRRGELYRDLAVRLHAASARPVTPHPCFDCAHRESCYPLERRVEDRVPAEELLVPLAFYDTAWIPVESHPFGFRESVALLGGAAPSDLEALAVPGAGDDPLRAATLAGLESSREQFLFAGDPTGLHALEVFYLKLAAFTSLLRGVRALHAGAGRPHLALSPDRIRGGLVAAQGTPLPSRWRLTLSLGDLVSTAPLEAAEALRGGDAPTVLSVPYPLPEAFVPDALARVASTNLFMRLLPRERRVDTTPQGAVVHVRAELLSDGYRDAEHGRLDLVRVVLEDPDAPGGRLALAGRRLDAITGGFVFEGASAPVPVASARRVEQLSGAASVEVNFLAGWSTPVDIVSLGLLLLRVLLVNDEQDPRALDREVVEKLAAAAAGGEGRLARLPGDAERQQRVRLGEALATAALKATPDQVLHRASDRALAPPATPPALWQDALLLALRMATNLPGFSVRGRLDDIDPALAAAPIDEVLEDLSILAERARGALIGSGGRNGLVQQVCDDFLADIREALELGATPQEAGDRTVIVRARGRS